MLIVHLLLSLNNEIYNIPLCKCCKTVFNEGTSQCILRQILIDCCCHYKKKKKILKNNPKITTHRVMVLES